MAKNIYLLIEEGFRELQSRLLVAIQAVDEECTVWIGQQWWFAENFARLPTGIVLFKGNNAIQVMNMRRAKQAGHAVASIEEEAFGLIRFDGEKLYDPKAAVFCDLFCVQGESLGAFVSDQAIANGTKVAVTGNPRADLLLAPNDAAIRTKAKAIREERGPFILVNTNYATINPFDIDTYNYFLRCVEVAVYDPDDPADMGRFDALVQWEHANLDLIMTFLRRWPKQGSMPIVLRPHPSEDSGFWREAMTNLAHVTVIEDQDHLAWIAASDIMIHTSSTTGLEARLLGAPSVNLCQRDDGLSSYFLSSLVNPMFHRVDEAMAHIAVEIDGSTPKSEPDALAAQAMREHLSVGVGGSSAEKIAASLTSMHPKTTRPGSSAPYLDVTNTARQADKARLDIEEIKARAPHLRVQEIAPMVVRLTRSRQ